MLNNKENERIKSIVKKLHKGIILCSDSKYKDDYIFACRPSVKEELQMRFKTLEAELEYNDTLETIMLRADDDPDMLNHETFNLSESIYLLLFKIIWIEESKNISKTDSVCTTVDDVLDRLTSLINRPDIAKETNVFKAVETFKRYGLVYTVGDLRANKDTKIIICRSIASITDLSGENEILERYKEYLDVKDYESEND